MCAASFALLRRGTPDDPMAISGCQSPDIVRPDSIFQAASLTKPVIAYETCGWQEGRDSIFTRRSRAIFRTATGIAKTFSRPKPLAPPTLFLPVR